MSSTWPTNTAATAALVERAERALTHALGASLGLEFKPKVHRGTEDPADVEAVATLRELRKTLGKEQ